MPEIGRNTFSYIRMRASGAIEWLNAALATDFLLNMRVVGDTNPRFRIRADGRLEWGPGNAALDTNLYRILPDILASEDLIRAYGQRFECTGGLAATVSFQAMAGGWTVPGITITRSGIMDWSSGAAAADCQLSRNAANELRTPDQLTVLNGVATFVKAGVPNDGDFPTAIDGLLAVDTTNSRLYARCGGVWKMVAIA